MATTSRRLSAKTAPSRPSHTTGKSKGGNCVKSELKTFGQHANPYKLKGHGLNRYAAYCRHTDGLNK